MPATGIGLVVFDVDGTLTDGGIHIGPGGEEWKRFHVHDGMGIAQLMRARLQVAFVTARRSAAVEARARDLGIDTLLQGVQDKLLAIRELGTMTGLEEDEIAYMGDDLNDIPVLRHVGFPMAPGDARPEVKSVAEFVARSHGGQGAAREACEQILRAQNRWGQIVEQYLT